MRKLTFIILIILVSGFVTSSDVYGKSRRHENLKPYSDKGITVLEDKRYFDVLLNHIDNAQHEIIISMYVFKTTGKRTNYADRIKYALIKAARRGADVQVLLEQEGVRGSSLNADNEQTAMELTKGGVKVYFDSPSKRTHVKAIVIDKLYSFIGSHNLTASALQYNNELSVMVESEEVARETVRYIGEIVGGFIK